MAGYYNKNKDYSLAIKQAQDRGASQAEINQLRQERQNKIDAQYGGSDPYRGNSNIMGGSSRPSGGSSRPSGGGSYSGGSRPSRSAGDYLSGSGGDYSLAIVRAQQAGADRSVIDQLRRERQNKIDAQYGGSDPYRGSSNIMGLSQRDWDRNVISRPGGVLYYDNGTPAVYNDGRVWKDGVDYAAEARKYAAMGDWDAVDDVLMRRQAKIDAQGGNDRGMSNLQIWNQLRGEYGFDIVTPDQPRPDGGFGGGGFGGGGFGGGGSGGFSSGSDYLENLYQKKLEAEMARLKAQWEQDAAGVQAHNDAMGDLYDQLRNRQAAQNDLERLRLSEMGQAHGLNTGTFGQLALGQSGVYQDAFAQIGRQEAADRAEGDWKLRQLEAAYRGAVQQAQAAGEAELMEKLYQEYVRQMEAQARARREAEERREREERYRQELAAAQSKAEREQADKQYRQTLERAKTLARHGDFSGYAALGYSPEEIKAMEAEWKRQQAKKKR